MTGDGFCRNMRSIRNIMNLLYRDILLRFQAISLLAEERREQREGMATTKPQPSEGERKTRALRWLVVEVKRHPVVGLDFGKPSAAQRLCCEQIVLFFSVYLQPHLSRSNQADSS